MCKAGLQGLSKSLAKFRPVQWIRVEWDGKKHVFTTNVGISPNECTQALAAATKRDAVYRWWTTENGVKAYGSVAGTKIINSTQRATDESSRCKIGPKKGFCIQDQSSLRIGLLISSRSH
jgi:hypothetical protein